MITIFRANYYDLAKRRYVTTWHATSEAGWRAAKAATPPDTPPGVRPLRGARIEPVNVIVTRDGVLRLLNKYAVGEVLLR